MAAPVFSQDPRPAVFGVVKRLNDIIQDDPLTQTNRSDLSISPLLLTFSAKKHLWLLRGKQYYEPHIYTPDFFHVFLVRLLSVGWHNTVLCDRCTRVGRWLPRWGKMDVWTPTSRDQQNPGRRLRGQCYCLHIFTYRSQTSKLLAVVLLLSFNQAPSPSYLQFHARILYIWLPHSLF